MPALGLGLGLQRRSSAGGYAFPFITAPDGVYAGEPLTITGGKPVAAIVDGGVLVPDEEAVLIYAFQFVINGTPVGDWFTERETTIPLTVMEGDTLQVQDAYERLSNSLTGLDPLAGVPILLDLRTHKGNKVPFGIADEGDPNATWTGVVGSATQPTSGKQPITMLAGDGTPYLDFTAASSQWMSIGEFAGGEYYYTVLVRSKTAAWNSYFGLIDAVNVDSRWGYCEAGNTYINASYAPRQNGVTLATPTTPLTDIDEWNVITIRTPAALTSIRGIAQLLEVQYGGIEMIAAAIHDGTPTSDQIQAVENYYQRLKPVP